MRCQIVKTAMRSKKIARGIKDTVDVDVSVRVSFLSLVINSERLKWVDKNLDCRHPNGTRVQFSN